MPLLATEIISKLNKLIEEHGDQYVVYWDSEQIPGFDDIDVVECRETVFRESKVFYLE